MTLKKVPGTCRRKKRRKKLFEEQQGKCYYCGEPMLYKDNFESNDKNPRNLTLEHLNHAKNPLRKTENVTNEQRLVAACYACNQKAGAKENVWWSKCDKEAGKPVGILE